MNYAQLFLCQRALHRKHGNSCNNDNLGVTLYGSIYREMLSNRATPKKVQPSYVFLARSKMKVAIKTVLITFQQPSVQNQQLQIFMKFDTEN